MRAVVYRGRHQARWEDVPDPTCPPGSVRIEVAFNGICGTDLHEVFDGPIFIPHDAPHPLTGAQLPQILGHEFSGLVVEVGAGVSDLAIGMRVAVEPYVVCGTCASCASGRDNLCDVRGIHGLSSPGGGLSEYTVVPRRMVHVLPDEVSLEHGALVEPMSVGLHAVRRSGVTPRCKVAVHGGGPIGISLVLALWASGVESVVVVEPSEFRRNALTGLGATVIDPNTADVVDAVREVTGGGADVSFDAAGAPQAFAAALASTAKGGLLTVVATHQPVTFRPNDLLLSELTISGSNGFCGEFPSVLKLMASGAYPLDGWVDHIAGDRLDHAFEMLRRGDAIKLLIDVAAATPAP